MPTIASALNIQPKFLRFLPLLLLTATQIRAQQFGGNPPSIKWNQVNTKAAKVIFPRGLDSAAQEVANIVAQMNKSIQPTIGYKQKQISIVLQNQTTIANAYVGLAPFRSEFFLTPEQNSFDIGSLPWPKQLAIHEFRHVQQYNNFDVGFSKVLRILFGEGGQALGNDLAVPNWFFEGDAVYNETLVSQQGRGRLPWFFNGYRALWAAGKDYSWMKLRNGSYHDYTPDWYPTGYMLVSYGREKYGDDFWKKVTQDAAAFKGGFYPLERAIKKYSGQNFKTFRGNAITHFKDYFDYEKRNPIVVPDSMLKKYTFVDVTYAKTIFPKHFEADHEYPAFIKDSTLIYIKSTYDHLPAFVIKTGDKEKKISIRSLSLDNHFDYHDGKVVYASYRPDLRWNYRDYSELRVLNIQTGTERRITKNTKYFAPSFSPEGKIIVTVQEATTGKCDIHLLNAEDGHLIKVLPNKDNLFFTYPKFYGNDKLVSAVRNEKGQMSLALINVKTGKIKYLLPFSYQPIGFINVKKDTIYFTATSDINDRLFALSLTDKKLFILQNYVEPDYIGNYQPAISDNKLAWVGFTNAGYRIVERDKRTLNWTQVNAALPDSLPNMNISALKRNPSAGLLANVVDSSLKVTKYNKSYHLFNFHSLIPTLNDPNYAIALEGENVLNTFQSELGFDYNRDEGYKQFSFDAIYGALFPYISGGVDYTVDRRGFYKGGNVYWNETDLHGGLEFPLNFSQGKNITGLAFGSDLYYSQSNFQQAFRSLFADRSYAYLNNYISFSNHIQQAKQNIFPRLGESISLNYKTAISGLSANQFLADGTFYLPGFWVNHNILINVAHQQKGGGNVIDFSNDFPFSRGYEAENLHDMNKIGANYHFPIAYPDAGVANTIYFLRIRGNLFYDYTRASDTFTNGTPFKGNFRSTGAEIYFDTQWFNQVPISFGFRYSYLQDPDIFGYTGKNRFEIIVPVTVF